jgi:hypothetical protein
MRNDETGHVKEPAIIDTRMTLGQCLLHILARHPPKKKPKPLRLGLNPPKEEGGGDKLVGARKPADIGSTTTSTLIRSHYGTDDSAHICAAQDTKGCILERFL